MNAERWMPLTVVLFAWSSAYLWLMFRIAPFELGLWDCVNIGLRSIVGPLMVLPMVLSIGRRVWRILTAAVVSLAFFGVIAAYGLFHSWSGTVPHAAMILHGGEVVEILPQVMHQVATGWLVCVVLMWLVQLIAIGCLPGRQLVSRRMCVMLIGVFVVLAVIHGAAVRAVWDAGDRVEARRLWVFDLNESVVRFGILDGWWRDARASIVRGRYPINQTWPGTLTGRAATPAGSSAKAHNVLLLQVESLDPWVIEAEVRGHTVMPHLHQLVKRSRAFPNFFAQHSGGGSSDAELALHLGVLPLATHSGLLSADWEASRPLPTLVARRGWRTAAFHANRPSYFNRNVVYPRLGFERFFSERDFVGEASGWESIDAEFMSQSLEYIDSMGEPFFASIITLQSHGPFRHHRNQPEADPGPGTPRLERDYLQVMHEIDEAIGVVSTWLEADGRRETTAVVLFGDHRSRARGPEPVGPERIPLLIVAPSLKPGNDLRVGSHLDLGPTVLDLVGLEAPEGWLGTSLLDGGPGVAVFNDLEEARLEDGQVVTGKNESRMPFLLYSAMVLGQ